VEAKQLRDIAEKRAKDAIMEHVTPRVKQLIEQELLGESDDKEDDEEKNVLMDSTEKKDEPKNETSEEIELTAEAVESLAKIAGAKAETYSVRALRLSNQVAQLHESNLDEASYIEKLRQIHKSTEKAYLGFMNEVKGGAIPSNAASLIEQKLEEVYETVNQLYVPEKAKLVAEAYVSLKKRFNNMNLVIENHTLKRDAQKSFRKMCRAMVKEAKALHNSLTELQAITENSKVDNFKVKVNGLVKEISKMAAKNGALNEEELNIIIRGLNTEDPQGSVLSAEIEDEADMTDGPEMDDMDLEVEDDMGDDVEDMDMDLDVDDDMDEMDELRYQTTHGTRGSHRRSKMRSIAQQRQKEREKEQQSQEEPTSEMEEMMDEMDEMDEYTMKFGAGARGRGRSRSKMKSIAQARADKRRGGADDDGIEDMTGLAKDLDDTERMSNTVKIGEMEEMEEQVEISEEMLKTELARLKRRRALRENMSQEGGHGAGHLDHFGGGSVEGEKFVDGEDLNDLDPVSEAEMDELRYQTTGRRARGSGRSGTPAAARPCRPGWSGGCARSSP
jgi:hypothetical protein